MPSPVTPTPTPSLSLSLSPTMTPSVTPSPSITPTQSPTPSITPTVTPTLNRNILNVQVVPSVPQMIKGANGQSQMNPQWIQYFRTLSSRVGEQTPTQLLSNTGSGSTLQFIAGAGITVDQTANTLTVSSQLPFTEVIGGTGIGVNITNQILTITNEGVTSFTLNDISTLPIFQTAPSVATTGAVVSNIQLNVQPSNAFLAGPIAPSTTAQPIFRLLNLADFQGIVFPVANGGTGLSGIPTNGQILIGDGTTFQLNTIAAGSGVTISNTAGEITISATGSGGTVTSIGITPGSGISVSGSPVTTSGNITVNNTGVLSFTSNTGLSTNVSATGAVTVTNTGVRSFTSNTGLSVNASATGAVTVTNTGVVSLAGTANQIAVSASTGSVTISLPQNMVIPTPTAGVALTITGFAGQHVVDIVSTSTTQIPDFNISRTGSVANTVQQAPNLTLRDSGGSTASTIQQAGGQTEIWQFNSGTWKEVMFFLSTGDMVVNGLPYFPGATTTANAANAYIDSTNNNQLVRSTSSVRYKDNVTDLNSEQINNLLKFRPITYTSLCAMDDKSLKYYGLIAEEVALIEPRLVDWHTDKKGNTIPENVAYDRMVVLLIGLVQSQETRIKALEAALSKS